MSHCRWLRISGESVFDRHRPSTTIPTYSLFKRKGIGPIDSYRGSDSGNLSNAVLVSLPLAQNQRGKRFRSSQAPPTPTYSLFKRKGIGPIDSYCGSHSGNLINAVLVSLPLAQNQRGKRFRSSQATQHRHQHTLFSDEKASAPSTRTMAVTLATSATLSLSHCRWLRISGESVFNHHRPLNIDTVALSFKQKHICFMNL